MRRRNHGSRLGRYIQCLRARETSISLDAFDHRAPQKRTSTPSPEVPDGVRRAVLIGVDLGPNLSVTGSLATILWLTALRREGLTVDAWTFLKLGILVMPPALLFAIGASSLFG